MEKLADAARSKVFPARDSKVLYLCPCKFFDLLCEEITPSSQKFGLLIAVDARGVSNTQIWAAAEKLIAKGLVYLCAWGPDCERVHDCFDEAMALKDGREITVDNVITAWHSRETLSEALCFFINSAFPDQSLEKTCREWIVTPIDNAEWQETVRADVAGMGYE